MILFSKLYSKYVKTIIGLTRRFCFENIFKELFDDKTDTLITNEKVRNEIYRNADSYYVNEKELDTETLN